MCVLSLVGLGALTLFASVVGAVLLREALNEEGRGRSHQRECGSIGSSQRTLRRTGYGLLAFASSKVP
jgi:hypothetical protein